MYHVRKNSFESNGSSFATKAPGLNIDDLKEYYSTVNFTKYPSTPNQALKRNNFTELGQNSKQFVSDLKKDLGVDMSPKSNN